MFRTTNRSIFRAWKQTPSIPLKKIDTKTTQQKNAYNPWFPGHRNNSDAAIVHEYFHSPAIPFSFPSSNFPSPISHSIFEPLSGFLWFLGQTLVLFLGNSTSFSLPSQSCESFLVWTNSILLNFSYTNLSIIRSPDRWNNNPLSYSSLISLMLWAV